MKSKIKDLTQLNTIPRSLPFNYEQWIVEGVNESSKNNKLCKSKDYMTSEYEIIPFYKPIINLALPKNE